MLSLHKQNKSHVCCQTVKTLLAGVHPPPHYIHSSHLMMRLRSVCTFQPQQLNDHSRSKERGLTSGSGCNSGSVFLNAFKNWMLNFRPPRSSVVSVSWQPRWLSPSFLPLQPLPVLSPSLSSLFILTDIQGEATRLPPPPPGPQTPVFSRCKPPRGSYLECNLLLAKSCSTPLAAD